MHSTVRVHPFVCTFVCSFLFAQFSMLVLVPVICSYVYIVHLRQTIEFLVCVPFPYNFDSSLQQYKYRLRKLVAAGAATKPIHVLIVGGGIAGVTVAQGPLRIWR